MDIQKRIKEILEEQEMTIRSLCSKLGIPESSLYRMFERNDYKLSTLQNIANSLDVSLFHLLEGVKIDNKPENNKAFELLEAQFQELKKLYEINENISDVQENYINSVEKYSNRVEKENEKLSEKIEKLENKIHELEKEKLLLVETIKIQEERLSKI